MGWGLWFAVPVSSVKRLPVWGWVVAVLSMDDALFTRAGLFLILGN